MTGAVVGVGAVVFLAAGVAGYLMRDTAADEAVPRSAQSTPAASGDQQPSDPGDGIAENQGAQDADPSSTRAASPRQALRLSSSAALAQLEQARADSLPVARDLAYEWVPQVSSKCVGLPRVDIKGPDGFFPDGAAETRNPGNQEILAFHLSLSQRYDTVTLLWRDVSPKPPRYPVCDDPTMMWHLFVARTFQTADDANDWCASEGFPADECFARYLVPKGQTGTEFKLR